MPLAARAPDISSTTSATSTVWHTISERQGINQTGVQLSGAEQFTFRDPER